VKKRPSCAPWIPFVALAVLAGCGGGDGDSPPAVPPPSESRNTVGPAGGTVELPNVARVVIPAGALVADSQVLVEQTKETRVQDNFSETASIFAATNSSPYEVRIDVGENQPTSSVSVTLQVPPEISSTATASQEVRALYLNVYQDLTESHESMEILPERANATANHITIDLPREAFYLSASGHYEAFLLLALTDTAGIRSQTSHISSLADLAAENDGECKGKSIGSPVDSSFDISSPYGPRPAPKAGASTFHRGIDYATPVGTDIFAVSDGTVSKVKINDGGINSGYGYYVEVTHTDGSISRYAHLLEGSALAEGTEVKRGQVIAKSGNTGNSTGPHLHFEYAPDGKLHKGGRVDPAACMGAVIKASLTVSDNGPIADDAFEVTLDGIVICTTSIGGTSNCGIGALRSGAYSLVLKVLIAPDDVGTFQITSNSPGLLVNGSNSVSGEGPEGSSFPFVLTVK
jgi:murein DD-endopeptidase MepM/ murein hydrolase activator NlpD